MTHKQGLKLHVRLIEPKEKLTTFPVVVGAAGGGAGGGYNPRELTPGGRLRRLADIHRGTVGFCQMEAMADANWRPKRNTKLTMGSPYTTAPDTNDPATVAGYQGGVTEEVQEYFPSVLRMLQSPRPWGESSSNDLAGRSASTIPLTGKLRPNKSPAGSKLKTLRPAEVSKSSSSLYSNSSRLRPHRARYCLLPSPEPLSSSSRAERLHPSKMASYGAHQEAFVHRATVLPHSGKACFTLTHMSSDNGLLHVIKPPVTPVDPYRHHWEQQDRASPHLSSSEQRRLTREGLSTPGVLSRLDRILHPGTRRVRERMASAASEEPSIGSGGAPDISTLLSDLGEDTETRMEDLEALTTLPSAKDAWSAYSSIANWSYPEQDIELDGEKSTLEITFMFPQNVRMGKVNLARSYNMDDPVDVTVFLEHLPDAFLTLSTKCELWLQTCPSTNYTLVL